MERRTPKRIWSIFLTLAMVLAMTVTALPVAAEGEAAGTGTATVHYEPAVAPVSAPDSHYDLDTTFSLYKVGHFERRDSGESYLALDEGIPNAGGKVNLDIKKSDYADEEGNVDESPDGEWTKAWQASAAALEEAIKKEGIQPIQSATCNDAGDAVFTGLADGLYLVSGPGLQKYMDTEKHESKYFTASPSLIQVLNHKASLTVKYVDEPWTKEYVMSKVWVIPEKYSAIKPESIQVQLKYRDSADAEWTNGDLITLNDKNNWTYEWNSEELDREWDWEEIMPDSDKIHFTYTCETRYGKSDQEQDNKKYIKMTNTYEKYQLKLTKVLDQFLSNGDNAATFAFEIRGYMGPKDNERLVYTGSAGLNFSGKGSLDTIVDNIPANLTRLEVEEVYSGNYAAVGGETGKKKNASFNLEEGIYEVSFENKFNDDTTIKGGIVNTYTNENGNIVLSNKDYGKTPQPLGPAQ